MFFYLAVEIRLGGYRLPTTGADEEKKWATAISCHSSVSVIRFDFIYLVFRTDGGGLNLPVW